jgi:glutaredoxin
VATSSPYRDIRQDFLKAHFQQALTYDAFLEAAPSPHRERWNTFESLIKVPESCRTILSSMGRQMNLLVLAGAWCGDCARQGPMLKAISKIAPKIDLRFADNHSNPELQEELRINGAEKVPVVVVLSEDFFEIARFGDRHLSVYRRKAAQELGAACDPGLLPPSSDELRTELEEWVYFIERAFYLLRLAPMLRKRYHD